MQLAAAVAFKLAGIDQSVALAASQPPIAQVQHGTTPVAARADEPAARPAVAMPRSRESSLDHAAPDIEPHAFICQKQHADIAHQPAIQQ
ncbi:MAG: hypothetical protein COY64_02810, partial [Hydrogenophilales bacterium CG_4_10_14_0_8_um_filter_62_70]